MVAQGYCTADQVAAWVGADLTEAQTADFTAWLEAAEDAINRYTGGRWQVYSGTGDAPPIVAEYHPLAGWRVNLASPPIASVTAVRGYLHGQQAISTALATDDVILMDAEQGILWVQVWEAYDYVQVDYVPEGTVPAPIAEATAALLADWIANRSASSGTVVSERFADAAVSYGRAPEYTAVDGLSARVRGLLDAWRPRAPMVA